MDGYSETAVVVTGDTVAEVEDDEFERQNGHQMIDEIGANEVDRRLQRVCYETIGVVGRVHSNHIPASDTHLSSSSLSSLLLL